MLPTLNLDLSKICQSRIDLFAGGKTSFIGRTRCYHLDQLRDAARQSNENLDRFITKHLAAGMGTKPVKSELLFWFAAGNDLIWLTPCDKALRVGCWWMNEIPGYWESGTEGVRDNAKPYAYWDGNNLYRIYALPESFHEDALYLNDLGTLFGLAVEECDEETHCSFRDEPMERWDYSVVPTESQEIVEVQASLLLASLGVDRETVARIVEESVQQVSSK
ncbi:MAG TPA: hypothetical protein VI837_06620 [Blastocatellia bacterium]|nr:hypothetical protein [Blastocatellia bacterium]